MNEQSTFLCFVCLVSMFLAGCGGEAAAPPPKLVPASGTVKLDGKPTAGISVSFIPRGNTKGTGASGVTDSSGKYTLTHRSQTPGVEVGTYTVIFSKMAMPDGSPIPEGKDAADVGATQVLPQKYTDPNNADSPNIATVSQAGGTFDFELTTK